MNKKIIFLAVAIMLLPMKTLLCQTSNSDTLWFKSVSSGNCNLAIFSPSGDTVIHNDGRLIILRDGSDGKALDTMIANSKVTCLDISNDGRILASASEPDYWVTLWDLETGDTIRTLFDASDVLYKWFVGYTDIDISPDGKKLLAVSGMNGSVGHPRILIYEVHSGALLFKKGTGNVDEVYHKGKFSPDGSFFVVGIRHLSWKNEHWRIEKWDSETFDYSGTFTNKYFYDFDISYDGNYFAYSGDPRLSVYDLKNNKYVFRRDDTLGNVGPISFSKDNNYIVERYGDFHEPRINIWNRESQNIIYSYDDIIYSYTIEINKGNDKILLSVGVGCLLLKSRFQPSSVIDNKYINYEFVYPNPTDGKVYLEFNLPQTSKVNIDINNLLSNRIESITTKIFNAGSNLFVINTSHLSPGIYLITLRNKFYIKSYKLIKE